MINRRFHLSSPNTKSSFKIIEDYVDDNKLQFIKDDTKFKDISEYSQNLAHDLIIKINKKNIKGHMLFFFFFLSGVNDIKLFVKYLNEKLPLDHVAIAYFAHLADKYKRTMFTNSLNKINSNRQKYTNNCLKFLIMTIILHIIMNINI